MSPEEKIIKKELWNLHGKAGEILDTISELKKRKD